MRSNTSDTRFSKTAIEKPRAAAAALLTLTMVCLAPAALAQDPASGGAEKVDIEGIKQRYWSQGEDAAVGVVQNRAFSKAKKVQVGLFGGTVISDPFLNTAGLGFTAAYFFDEYFGVGVMGLGHSVSDSSALAEFRRLNGGDANTNEPKSYFGIEGTASLLYGKLSLIGASIIYYDMHASLGMGATWTESGRYFTPSIGIGQRFYVTKWSSIRFDYRLMPYRERIIEKVVPTERGQYKGSRNNFSNTITLGVDILWDLF